LEANRNRTSPFWSHPDLRPLDGSLVIPPPPDSDFPSFVNDDPINDDEDDGELEAEDRRQGGLTATFDEELDLCINMLRRTTERLEYQRQFRDMWFLRTFKTQGAQFFRYIEDIQDYERRTDSTRGDRPTTWGENNNLMFYRTPPPDREAST